MVQRMDSLLGHIKAACPDTQTFLADVISTGERPDMEQCIKDYNKLVPGIVKAWSAKGMKVFFVAVRFSTLALKSLIQFARFTYISME
jgi:hypothetical protein